MKSLSLVEFDQLKSDIATLVSPTMKIQVSDFQSSQAAIETAKQVKDYLNRLEKKRKELVDPLNAQVKIINTYAKDIESPLRDAERHIKSELVTFELEQEKIRQAEFKKAEEERLKREAELRIKQEAERISTPQVVADDWFGAGDESLQAERELKEKHTAEQAALLNRASEEAWAIKQRGIKNTRKTWKCEVTDMTKVPKEFLIITLNEKMVLAAARAGVTEIAGVRLYQETSVAIGSNTYVPRQALEEVD